MEAATQPAPRPLAPPQPAEPEAQLRSGDDVADGLADALHLATKIVRCWFTPPFDWWREAVDQAYVLIRRTLFPTALSLFAFGFGTVAVTGGGLLSELGSVDRLGGAYSLASLREYVPYVTAMVVAGVAGTAVCADLGARKVRDELDAMQVMGVDAIRTLVAPRVLALTMAMPALTIVGLIASTLSGVAAVGTYGGTVGGFMETFRVGFTEVDLIANIVKTIIFGFLIGIVCTYKGMHAGGGSAGVGRAVNQAVVIAFITVFIFNFAFNSTYLASFPSSQDLK
jgi:phospholipid/cholesterol/gamma-HCH transport system permease protein